MSARESQSKLSPYESFSRQAFECTSNDEYQKAADYIWELLDLEPQRLIEYIGQLIRREQQSPSMIQVTPIQNEWSQQMFTALGYVDITTYVIPITQNYLYDSFFTILGLYELTPTNIAYELLANTEGIQSVLLELSRGRDYLFFVQYEIAVRIALYIDRMMDGHHIPIPLFFQIISEEMMPDIAEQLFPSSNIFSTDGRSRSIPDENELPAGVTVENVPGIPYPPYL